MALEIAVIVRQVFADRGKLYGYILSILPDAHLAEDVLQEVSIRAVEKRQEIRDLDALGSWLRSTARFEALNALRKHNRGPLCLDQTVLDQLDKQWKRYDETPSSAMLDALRHCMGQLNDYGHRLLQLRYTEGLVGPKLADAMGKKHNTVFVALSRVHATLTDCVTKRMADHHD